MKKRSVFLFLVLMGLSCYSQGYQNSDEETARLYALNTFKGHYNSISTNVLPGSSDGEEDTGELASKLYIGAGFSLMNSYKIGNALDFWRNINYDNTEEIEQATGFFVVKFGFLDQFNEKSWLGVEDQVVITPSHALWGTNLYFGGRNEIHFRAIMMNIALSYAHALDSKNSLLFLVQPGLDLGYMGGSVTIDNNYFKQSLALGIGGHGAIGLEYIPVNNLIADISLGYRYLNIKETHQDSGSDTGYSTFYVEGSDGETVKADWSGLYVTVSISLAINRHRK